MIERILGGLFLSDIEPLNNNVDLKTQYGITHIISVVPGPISSQYTTEYTHKQIDITDEETSNIAQYFEECNEFLQNALYPVDPEEEADAETKKIAPKTNVLVHCAQGESRSVTIIVAFLMLHFKLGPKQALYAVTRKCKGAEPNPGFLHQLELYHSWGCKVDPTNPEYKQFVAELSLKKDPTGESLRESMSKLTVDPAVSTAESAFELRCKKCRRVLSKSSHIENHSPPDATSRESQFLRTAPNSRRIISAQAGSSSCSHYFLSDPLTWMKDELSKEEIEGKFLCPKCESKVGGYSWKGSRCSCGKWMVPAIHLQSAKVDNIKSQPVLPNTKTT